MEGMIVMAMKADRGGRERRENNYMVIISEKER